jgi:uncharacterized protein YggE
MSEPFFPAMIPPICRLSFLVALCVAPLPLSASPVPDFPFIAVSGHADRRVAPTKATVSFKVLAHAAESAEASKTVSDTLKLLVKDLAEFGIGEKQISAHDLEKDVVRERNEEHQQLKILGYDVSRGVELTLPDLKKYPEIVRKLMATNHVTRVSSDFDTDDREALKAEMIAEACAKARKKADLLAKGVGVTIKSVFAVTDRSLNGLDGVYFGSTGGHSVLPGFGGGDEDVPIFAPATIEVSTYVEVLYKLE